MLGGHALHAAHYPAPAMNNINAAHPANITKLYNPELPDSQESLTSAASSAFAASQFLSPSSNISTSTAADTDLTSPSSNVPPSHSQSAERMNPPSPRQARGHDAEQTVPRVATANLPRTGDTAASPISADSPVVQGFKRTADGAIKGVSVDADSAVWPVHAHKRNKSMESGSTSRIGELSAQLKTRLSYAMVKVQNGWEKQSLEELEEQESQRGSPISVPGRSEGSRLILESPRSVDRRRRPSGVSENSDHIMFSPGQTTPSELSKSVGATPSSFWRAGVKPTMHASVNLMTVMDTAPPLGPPPDVGARRKRRSSTSHAPPPLLASTQRKHYSDLSGMGSTPRTPATPRPGILRMPSQQAEKDAVDTLLFMSSPKNSGHFPQNSMDASHPSPLKSEVPPSTRRVMFETQPVVGRVVSSQNQMPAPSKPYGAYYRADLTR